ncbi:AMME syndrome candidate 1 protein [Dirofilaria immitis]|nr:AMME syndrome candidate 1 protein [Dirofilaria immitis]
MIEFWSSSVERAVNKETCSKPGFHQAKPISAWGLGKRITLVVTSFDSKSKRVVINVDSKHSHGWWNRHFDLAFKDSRFDPITLHEVDQLHCTVSILINFEKARDYRDWIVGIHGIRIEFQDNHHYRDAVYLPEVASEQGWDHTETIDNLMRKGGYRGHISEETRMKVSVVRFQSDKVLMSHQEYMDYKSNYGEPLLTDPGGRREDAIYARTIYSFEYADYLWGLLQLIPIYPYLGNSATLACLIRGIIFQNIESELMKSELFDLRTRNIKEIKILSVRLQTRCNSTNASRLRACLCSAREEFENRIQISILQCVRQNHTKQLYRQRQKLQTQWHEQQNKYFNKLIISTGKK